MTVEPDGPARPSGEVEASFAATILSSSPTTVAVTPTTSPETSTTARPAEGTPEREAQEHATSTVPPTTVPVVDVAGADTVDPSTTAAVAAEGTPQAEAAEGASGRVETAAEQSGEKILGVNLEVGFHHRRSRDRVDTRSPLSSWPAGHEPHCGQPRLLRIGRGCGPPQLRIQADRCRKRRRHRRDGRRRPRPRCGRWHGRRPGSGLSTAAASLVSACALLLNPSDLVETITERQQRIVARLMPVDVLMNTRWQRMQRIVASPCRATGGAAMSTPDREEGRERLHEEVRDTYAAAARR